MVLQQFFLSFPGGFILRVVAPLNFVKLDNLAAGDSAGILKNLDYPTESLPAGTVSLSGISAISAWHFFNCEMWNTS